MYLNNLTEAKAALDALERASSPTPRTAWSISKTLLHCAQSIDASIHGYPAMKPALLRKTVGRVVVWRFLRKGQMNHNKEQPVPGAADIPDDDDPGSAMAALRESIDNFLGHDGPLAPHFVFDLLTKDEYERIHAMHLADHLTAIDHERPSA